MTDTWEGILNELRSLYPDDREIVLKESHVRVTHLAHGWYMRVQRSCEGVMVLREAGLGAEAWPMRRAALEHVLALKWLAEKGNEATDVVIRSHSESARKPQDAGAKAGSISAGWPIWSEVKEDGEAATGNMTENNMLFNVRERCAKYGLAGDYASWLLETNHSHPGWETSSPYAERAPIRLLSEPRFDEGMGDAEFCSRRILRSLVSLSDMAADPPWPGRLTDIAARMAVLG